MTENVSFETLIQHLVLLVVVWDVILYINWQAFSDDITNCLDFRALWYNRKWALELENLTKFEHLLPLANLVTLSELI